MERISKSVGKDAERGKFQRRNRMKAVLVIDVQMTEDGKHICNSCPVWDEKGCMCKYDFMFGHKGCPLRPLPQRKLEWYWGQGAHDWNACLDEIIGETE